MSCNLSPAHPACQCFSFSICSLVSNINLSIFHRTKKRKQRDEKGYEYNYGRKDGWKSTSRTHARLRCLYPAQLPYGGRILGRRGPASTIDCLSCPILSRPVSTQVRATCIACRLLCLRSSRFVPGSQTSPLIQDERGQEKRLIVYD
ncbi:hypothetical protein JMJ77_0009606 [Colletotrichum scovillei]|uniref:Uncharacterized protein n=1 Tax=Colletotrichum scovillei TaxID=1209932 RepID=A0A9P7R0C9_9PEZI|nr:hypothetical protein JMJ77_0009606 [Colletotrichum scovillei]KAG7052688.1 hypothetical protein JMJ78_0005702 [Colletotrichum scovillei]KAG7064978.1 hypothetical protein JMJ76_0012733 [Colletotrichum scovillei]